MARGGVTIDFTANLARFSSSIDKATEDLNRFQSNAQRVGKNLKGIFSGLGVALTVGGFAAATKAALNFADGIADAAEKTAFTTTKLQELSFAAGQNGVDFATLEGALARFTKRLGLARRDTGAAAATYKQLGIDLQQSNEQVFNQVVATFGRMENQTDKLALATRLFGDDAQRMAVVLDQGQAGLDAYADKARRLGLILSDDLVQGASEANDQLDIMSRVTQAQVTRGLVSLAPIITAIGQSFAWAAERVGEFYRAISSGPSVTEIRQERIEELQRSAEEVERKIARLQLKRSYRDNSAEIAQLEQKLASIRNLIDVLRDSLNDPEFRALENERGAAPAPTLPPPIDLGEWSAAGVQVKKTAKDIKTASKDAAGATEQWADDMDRALDLIEGEFRKLDDDAARAFAGLERGAQKATTTLDDLKLVIEDWARDVTDTLLDFRGDFGAIFEDLGMMVARMVVQRKIADPLVSGLDSFIGSLDFGGIGSALGGLFGNAQGGLYKVAGSGAGERPVAFTAQPGEYVQVYPKGAGAGGAGGVNINFNITSLDPQSAANVIVQNRETIVSVVRSAFNRAGSSPRMA